MRKRIKLPRARITAFAQRYARKTRSKDESTPLDVTHRQIDAAVNYLSIFEHIGIATAILEEDFTIAIVNTEFERITGYSRDEVITKNWKELVVQDDFSTLINAQCFKNFASSIPNNYEIQFIDKHGNIRDILMIISSIAGSNKIGVSFLYTSDIKLVKKWQKVLNQTVKSLVALLEIRDPYTAGHQRRVAQLACAIATQMGLSKHRIEGLAVMGNLHDLVKITVPAEILSKTAPLTDAEVAIIKTHCQTGFNILKDIEFPWSVAAVVLQHHEKLDGSGYPVGLTGKDIILETKILTVADVVEAISSHRPYRPSLGIDKALDEILQNRGVLYDTEVVDACIFLFEHDHFNFSD
ncbi:MAG: HD domain-containing phosphohydrolase [Bacillota bacterium]|nr:HD domain-containing phosphohydrolase [Bacillota bacterium]